VDSPPPPHDRPPGRVRLVRYLPLAVLAAVGAVAWWTGVLHALAPAELGRHTAQLAQAANTQPILALGGFILAYAALTGACLPVALVLSLLSGLLFGRWLGAVGVLLGGTGGALITYAATRSAFAHALVARAERDPRLQRIVAGFGRRAFGVVLTMRLIPMFPFALVNVGSGLAAVPAAAFAAATLLGGIPTSFIYASLGAGLGQALASEQSLVAAVRSPEVVGPLAALALLSLAPAAVRRLRRRAAP
jgi:uncharacterized membrane protein YdjX (TVP38/TMEM64 family)